VERCPLEEIGHGTPVERRRCNVIRNQASKIHTASLPGRLSNEVSRNGIAKRAQNRWPSAAVARRERRTSTGTLDALRPPAVRRRAIRAGCGLSLVCLRALEDSPMTLEPRSRGWPGLAAHSAMTVTVTTRGATCRGVDGDVRSPRPSARGHGAFWGRAGRTGSHPIRST
jgi:hypothetical protein